MAQQVSKGEVGKKTLRSYKDARDLVNFERLEWNLMDLLTKFWKSKKHPLWVTPPDALQQIVRRIYMQHSMEMCVQAELVDYLHQLAEAKAFAMKGSIVAEARNYAESDAPSPSGRVGFWDVFHRGTRKGEFRPITPAKTQLYLPDINGAGWVRPGRSNVLSAQHGHNDDVAHGTEKGPATQALRKGEASKSAPVLGRQEQKQKDKRGAGGKPKVPSIGVELRRLAVAGDEGTFTPPGSMRGSLAEAKTWWFQSRKPPLVETTQTDFLSSRKSSCWQHVPAQETSKAFLPRLASLSSGSPIAHFGPRPVAPGESLLPTPQPILEEPLHLPPIQQAVVPVHDQSLKSGEEDATWSAVNYIRACVREQILPVPSNFVTGHSRRVDAVAKASTDAELLTLCAIGRLAEVEDVDLSSKLLSDATIARFCQDVLLADQNLRTLRRLSLKDSHAARHSQAALIRLLQKDGATKLSFLDLSGVSMSLRNLRLFCETVEGHPSLQTLKLSNTGLGGACGAMDIKSCLARVLRNSCLQVLDLGWNCFPAEELKFLGELIARNRNVSHLSLANCASSSQKNHSISPCVYFLEQLVNGTSLRSLDISMNRLDFRGALIIEDALDQSRQLTKLSMSHNPLGVMGLRCLLRLLARPHSGLIAFEIENCFKGELLASVEGIQVFTYTNPGGHYCLDLERPYHRSLLRTLYKVGERFQLKPADTFSNVTFSPGAFSLPSQRDAGVWPVPTSGRLEVNFSIEKAMQQAVHGVAEENFGEVLVRYNEVMRFTPHFRKLIPLLAQWRLLEGHEQEQLAMLAALGRDFIFTSTHLRQLCACRAMLGTTVARLLPTLVGGKFARSMVLRCVDNLSEFVKMLTLCKEYLLFNPDSPTGHYKLDLGNPAAAYVAQALALLDRWESGIAKRKELPDISEDGDYSCVRNCRYAHQSLRSLGLQSFDEWVLPEKEILELDYVTHLRPDCHGEVMTAATFTRFLTILQQAECDGPTQIKVTRNLAHYINLTSVQMRQLLGVYRTSELREEALVTTFFRIVDIHNEKVFRVRYEEQAELDSLRQRLGYCTFFTYIQPEQVTYDFDFAKYDQRLAANLFFGLANAEKRDNISNFRYTLPDGTIDKLEQGVPRSWDQFARMPKEGVFHFTYKCSPQDRRFSLRKSLLFQFGKWKVDVAEDEVNWWAAAAEAPEDVLEFLFWMRSRFRDTQKAFEAFDGADGNGLLGLREFEEGMKQLKCQKFRGRDEKQRWTAIFRFLDPSGEGQVSKEEFLTLDSFWAEVEFSIREFLDWSNRKYGMDLRTLWNALDEDGSGAIQRFEWESVLDKVGYFGPSGPIFSYVDEDDGGEISWKEFQLLGRFQDAPSAPCS